MRIRILDEKGQFHNLAISDGETRSLHAILVENHFYLPAPCGGKGNCGHCLVQIISGQLDISEKDSVFLSETQLSHGFRLACQAYPKDTISIRLIKNSIQEFSLKKNPEFVPTATSKYIIAIDLGSTTLAYALLDVTSKKIIQTMSSTNPQSSFGSDIMSRMEASNNGAGEALSNCITNKISKDLKDFISYIPKKAIQEIMISANTAMVHLLMNYSCKSLSSYPFKPVTLKELLLSSKDLKIFDFDIPVVIMQGLSAFVGGDIFSGIYYLRKKQNEAFKKPWLLIDLGTNAEMVLYNGKKKLYITSAPAGPAFEAANISCGTAAIDGAITKCNIIQNELSFETIHNRKAIGLCGSGLIELCYELLKNGFIDETGLLKDPFFEEGYPIISNNENCLFLKQEDIRALQMAKSAVFSALQILLEKANLQYEDLQNVYLAGNFGNFLNLKKATGITLLPEELLDKIKILGNSSLKGAIEYGLQNKDHFIKSVIEKKNETIENSELYDNTEIEEIILANEDEFHNYYYKNMYFNKRPL